MDDRNVLLKLVAAPALEERLVDFLLAREDVAGFTSHAASGHGSAHGHLSRAERVAGRQTRVAFELMLSLEGARDVVRELGDAFGEADLHYWIVPVLEGGPLPRSDV